MGSNTKKNRKSSQREPEITCPQCGSPNLTYVKDKRKVPTKWQWHVGAAVVCLAFIPIMPWFSAAFAVVYLYFVLFHKHRVLVGTCQDCGAETLFNQPLDGSDKPDFNQGWM